MSKVLVIGGNATSKAEVMMTVLGAETAGADLIHLYSCSKYLGEAKHYPLNFLLYEFKSHTGSLGLYDVKVIHEIAQDIDVIAIGNGLGKDFDAKKALLAIINTNKPIIIDADAIVPEILKIYDSTKHHWILTPNVNEFESLFGIEAMPSNILEVSQKHKINLCVKGCIDYIITPNDFKVTSYDLLQNDFNDMDDGKKIYENHTGVTQMKSIGAGNILTGIICGYVAQGLTASHAMKLATYLFGKCAEELIKTSSTISAESLAKFFPQYNAK
jgi:NAD(P)H-hydrate epimerase